jgi:hypothetical protein
MSNTESADFYIRLAIKDSNWTTVVNIMSEYFGKPFANIKEVNIISGDVPLEVNILYHDHRYVWEEYDGFWFRRSIDGERINIYTRNSTL